MTPKEKVKAYLENLRKAKDLLEQISTELKGGEDNSEDERTRKAILAFIKSSSDTQKLPTQEYSKWIEYLEKRQDQKSPSAEEVLVRAGLQPYKDGNQWCILAGDNIQEGICGFGDTPEDALCEFLKEVLDLQRKQKHYWKPTETDVALFNKAVTTNKTLTHAERTQLDMIRCKFGCCRATNCIGIMQPERKSAGWVLPKDFEEAVYKVANFISPFNQQELREVSHLFAEQLLSLAKKELNKAAQWNEGKRIRKVLVSIVKWLGFDSSFFTDNSVTKSEVLAWLEKQGEQEQPQVYETEDGTTITYSETEGHKVCDEKQKPAEWSEEDQTRLKVIKEELERYVMLKQYGTPLSTDDIFWLKSLPERFNLQPQAQPEQKPEAKLTGWVARDRSGEIWVYSDYPDKNKISEQEFWFGDNCMPIDQEFFPNIKWETGPVKVEVTVKKK